MSSNSLLTEMEAALHLGITPELLFEYTRYIPKSSLGHSKKLTYIVNKFERGFSLESLNEWDTYLKEPWANKGDKRPVIPKYVQDYLKVESGGKCALCGKGHKLEDAHIIPYEESLSHHHHNLIRLCVGCHRKYDDGIILRETITSLKAVLVEQIRKRIKENIHFTSKNLFFVPNPNHLFIGREHELSVLGEKLKRERVIVIQGPGGIGKTQLLLQVLSTEVTPIQTIWLDLDDYESIDDVEAALYQSLAKLNVGIDKTGNIFDLIRDKELRIVLDGLDRLALTDWDKVFDFITNLVNFTELPHFVITTQIELGNTDWDVFVFTVKNLEATTAKELIKKATENSLATEQEIYIDWLVKFCKGHPLSLKLISSLINHYKDSKIVVERLQSVGSSFIKDPRRKVQNRLTSLDTCLNAIYSCLTDKQKRLLQFVSNFPAGCPEHLVSVWTHSDIYRDDIAQIERFFFVESEIDIFGITRFSMLNPISVFVRSHWAKNFYKEAAEIQLDAAENLIVYVAVLSQNYIETQETPDDLTYGLYRVDYEMPNFIHALRYSTWCSDNCKEAGKSSEKYLRVTMGLALGLGKYFFVRDRYKLGEDFLTNGINACEFLNEFELASLLCQYYIQILSKQNKTKEIAVATGRLISFAQKSHDPISRARALLSCGDLALEQRNYSESIENYSKAVDCFLPNADKHIKGEFVDDGEFYVGSLGLALAGKGRVCENQHRPKEALEFYVEALRYTSFIQDFTNLGVIHHQMGNCYSNLGNIQDAISHYLDSAHLFVKTQQGQFLSNSLSELSDIATQTRQFVLISKLLDLESEWLFFALDQVREDIAPLAAGNYQGDHLVTDILILRKAADIIKLISFTSSISELLSWCEDSLEKLLGIQIQEEAQTFRPQSYYQKTILIIFVLGMRVSSYWQPKAQLAEDQLYDLCDLCLALDEQFNPDIPFHAFPQSFKWLEEWLKYWNLYKALTAEELFNIFEEVLQKEMSPGYEDEESQ